MSAHGVLVMMPICVPVDIYCEVVLKVQLYEMTDWDGSNKARYLESQNAD